MEKMNKAHELSLQILHTRIAFRQAILKAVRQSGIEMTFEMLQVMNRLWTQDAQSQQALADQTAKDKSSMTKLVDNLIKRGWVQRQEDSTDRRNRLICLTQEGKEMARIVEPIVDRFYTSLEEKFSEGELDNCMRVMRKIEKIMTGK